MLGMRLCVMHNLYYYNHLMETIRAAIRNNTWKETKYKLISDIDSGDYKND